MLSFSHAISTMAKKSTDQKASKSSKATSTVSAAASTIRQTFTRLGSFRKRSSSSSIRPTEPDNTPDSISFHNNNNNKIGCSNSRKSENNGADASSGITATNGYNNHQGLNVALNKYAASANDNFTASDSANGSPSYHAIQHEMNSSNSIIKYQKPKEINYNYYDENYTEFTSEPVNQKEFKLKPLIFSGATIGHFDIMENLSINPVDSSDDNHGDVVYTIDEMDQLRNTQRTVNLTDQRNQSMIKCSTLNGKFQPTNEKQVDELSTNQLNRSGTKSPSIATRLVFDANGDIVNSITDHHPVHRFGNLSECAEIREEVNGISSRNNSPMVVVSSELSFEDNDSEIVQLFTDSSPNEMHNNNCLQTIDSTAHPRNCISTSALSDSNYTINNNSNHIDPNKQFSSLVDADHSKVSQQQQSNVTVNLDERNIHNYLQINNNNNANNECNYNDDLYSNVNIKATTESIYSSYYPSSSSTIDSSINKSISHFSKQSKPGSTDIYEPILPSHSNHSFKSDNYYQLLRPSASPSPALSLTNSAQSSSYSNNSQLSSTMWPFTSSSRSPLSRAASFTSRNEYYKKYGGVPKGQSPNSNMFYIMKHLQNKYPQYDILSRYAKSRNNNRTNSSSQKTGSAAAAAGAESTKKSESNNHNSTESSKPHRSSKSANQTLSNTSHNANRSASTTPLDRNFYNFQTNQSSLFDDDPGIMSEIETSATGFRRGNKVRSSLPIVRTPSKSQDRSLGLVFLQFRTETKRALLPNEITSIDTVKALFVRSFPRQLSMEYLDHPSARIYIHDPSKDMFYELEDLRDVKDRCILRIYEQGVNGPQPGGSGLPIPYTGGGGGNAAPDVENYGYFSEPEFDSEYQSQHIHRKRFPSPIVGQSLMVGTNPVSQSQYYGTILLPPQYRPANLGPRQPFLPNQNLPGQPPQPPARNKQYSGYSQTLPRGTHLMSPTAISAINNPFAMIGAGQQPPPKPQRSFNNAQGGLIMIQGIPPRPSPLNGPMPPNPAIVPQPIAYHQNRPLPDRPYSVAGHYPPDRNGPSPRVPYPPGSVPNNQEFSGYLSSPEHRPSAAMLALHSGQPHPRASFSGFPSSTRPFEAEMAGSTAAPVAYPPAYGARHATNPAMDDESRVRMHEMERQIASLTNVVSKALGGSKPAPPPKPASLVGHRSELNANLPTDSLTQLRQIRRRARDLRSDIRSLKRLALQQTSNTKEILQETCNKMKSALMFLSASDVQLRLERLRISTERDSYNEDASRLDKDLLELEAKVEELRSNVINRRCRVNMSNVESMALILSRASKTVADLKARYPSMAQILKKIMTQELQQIEKEEKFFKEEPDRLEHSLKRCKKLTGTLVTLKRLASVQEQRSSTNPNTSSPSQLFDKKDGSGDETSSPGNNGPTSGGSGSNRDTYMSRSYDTDLMAPPHTIIQVTPATPSSTDSSSKNSSNVLENLLDELQTFSKQSSIDSPSSSTGTVMQRSSGSLRGSSSRSSNVPFDNPNSDTIARKARSKSYSSLRANSEPPGTRTRGASIPDGTVDLENIALLASTCGNVAANTAALVEKRFAQSRQELLEQRHQELLRKQRQLQEQYTRLQLLSRGQIPRGFLNDLKKTGSESNIVSKISSSCGGGGDISGAGGSGAVGRGVQMSSTVHGSLRNLANQGYGMQPQQSNTLPNSAKIGELKRAGANDKPQANGTVRSGETAVTKKIFETDIL